MYILLKIKLLKSLVNIKEANITKTAMIVVGDVLEPGDFNASKLYDKSFKHEYRWVLYKPNNTN